MQHIFSEIKQGDCTWKTVFAQRASGGDTGRREGRTVTEPFEDHALWVSGVSCGGKGMPARSCGGFPPSTSPDPCAGPSPVLRGSSNGWRS